MHLSEAQNRESGIIIQARTGSSRYAGKTILPFYRGRSILDIVIDACKRTVLKDSVIVATTDAYSDEAIVRIAEANGVRFFRGSEADVLKRFIDAALTFGIDNIVRVCADNPFLESEGTDFLIQEFLSRDADYVAFKLSDGMPSIKSHIGLWPEVVRTSALREAARRTSDDVYHEHVTNFIYEHPDLFSLSLIEAPGVLGQRSDIRLTVDTEDDFNTVRHLYGVLHEGIGAAGTDRLIEYVDSHPDILQAMKTQIDRNRK